MPFRTGNRAFKRACLFLPANWIYAKGAAKSPLWHRVINRFHPLNLGERSLLFAVFAVVDLVAGPIFVYAFIPDMFVFLAFWVFAALFMFMFHKPITTYLILILPKLSKAIAYDI